MGCYNEIVYIWLLGGRQVEEERLTSPTITWMVERVYIVHGRDMDTDDYEDG